MKTSPANVKIVPKPRTAPSLTIFRRLRKNASSAALQNDAPVIAIFFFLESFCTNNKIKLLGYKHAS